LLFTRLLGYWADFYLYSTISTAWQLLYGP
jgi:hypothetical protein